MFDIDHFKAINDQFGHLKGDELLQRVGAQLAKIVRATDIRCRYGGDEFMVILPDTPALGAEQVAECVRKEMALLTVASDETTLHVTASIGGATSINGDRTANALIERADGALYQAKRGGRNRYCVANQPTAAPLALVRS